MSETLFDELKRYVAFGLEDQAALRSLHPVAAPEFQRISEVFYERILAHDSARKALEGGESSVGRLKVTLEAWMHQLVQGPWDEVYFQRRCRIGRVHVKIDLPQHYMFGAMNVIRREFESVIDQKHEGPPEALRAVRSAVNKVLDLELAIMLHTYREDLLAQNAQQERLATFGQLVGSIGHELRNPLSVIETSTYLLKGRVGEDARAQKHVERIGEQVTLSNEIISGLLDLIRDRPLIREPMVLGTLIQEVVANLTKPDNVIVTVSGVVALPLVEGDARQVRQVIANVLANAVAAVGRTGTIGVFGAVVANMVQLEFSDDGPGVDEAIRRRLFEPLVTTKDQGIGLGLALVKRIVERHGGDVAYHAHSTGGARFVVRLPPKAP